MAKPFIVLLHFDNGHVNDTMAFTTYSEALNYARHCVSHTGSVHRIEIEEGAGVRAVWDRSWSPASNATLFRDYD